MFAPNNSAYTNQPTEFDDAWRVKSTYQFSVILLNVLFLSIKCSYTVAERERERDSDGANGAGWRKKGTGGEWKSARLMAA